MPSFLLGIAGSSGLVLASLRFTYTRINLKKLTTILISCGFVAIIVGVINIYASHFELQASVPPGWSGQPSSTPQILVGVLFLSWPVSAGVVAIVGLWWNHA